MIKDVLIASGKFGICECEKCQFKKVKVGK